MKNSRLVVGLMSGTSLDGVDAALVRIVRSEQDCSVQLKHFISNPYPKEVGQAILRVASGRRVEAGFISHLGVLLGRLYAEAVKDVCRTAGVPLGPAGSDRLPRADHLPPVRPRRLLRPAGRLHPADRRGRRAGGGDGSDHRFGLPPRRHGGRRGPGHRSFRWWTSCCSAIPGWDGCC